MSNTVKKIVIKGAREHNLKNISLEIPRDKLITITGLSGSGKSSLAFDTIYAEGQRRYVESLSAYARQFLDRMRKPDVDLIEGLSPAISIEQKTTSKNPRSIVATVTEIYDYMRVLYARIGIPYSPFTGKPIKSQTVSEMVDRILNLPKQSKIQIFAPIVRGRKGEYKKELLGYKKRGFQKTRIDGKIYEIDESPTLNKNIKHDIDIYIDGFINDKKEQQRIAESIETTLSLSDGLVYVDFINENLPKEFKKSEKIVFSSKFACPESGFTIEEIEPRLFSFNSPYGACPECEGIGVDLYIDPKLVIPNEKKSLIDGAIVPWSSSSTLYYAQTLSSLAKHYDFSLETPWKDLPKKIQDIILYGSDEEEIKFSYDDGYEKYSNKKTFEGVVNNLERKYLETDSDWKRDEISQFQNETECDRCKGMRLKEEALSVKIKELNISEVSKMSIQSAYEWFSSLPNYLTEKENKISVHILKEINERLSFLINVGLDYLNLSRSSGTLSGGESQRIRLASQIGSGLTGVLYVLDEPSIGLHQKDNIKLLNALKRLRDLGNTVIVVEHDEEAMLNSDYIIDLGPGAGTEGGKIIAMGSPSEIKENEHSITGQYLSGKKYISIPQIRRKAKDGRYLSLSGATGNNLQNVSTKIPLGTFTAVTGVSGSGKSTFVLHTLYRALNLMINKTITKNMPKPFKGIQGYEYLDKIIDIDQSPIGVQCDVCKGNRYNRETLEIRFKDKNIADVLNMTVDEGVMFFENISSIRDKLLTLQKVGLGYIKIGQQATTLSGGEAQRIKLAKELSKRATGRTIYILDEPTTGLHVHDVKKLLEVLHTFVNKGNTVIVIEHNLDVIKTADWIIDMGPEGGVKGGKIIAEGTPEDVSITNGSYTGEFLKKILSKNISRKSA